MKVVCEYCNSLIKDTEDKCPNCGAGNIHMSRTPVAVPKTMVELQQWCWQKNVTVEKTRFFLGIDSGEICASGIYQDEKTGNFIVYKNIFNGSRTIFYDGRDEAYAVYDCYMRLREQLLKPEPVLIHQRSHTESDVPPYDPQEAFRNLTQINAKYENTKKEKPLWKVWFPFILIAVVALFLLFGPTNEPDEGYYIFEDNIFYYQKNVDHWYEFMRSEPQDDCEYPYAGNWSITKPEVKLSCFNSRYYSANEIEGAKTFPDFQLSSYHVLGSGKS